MIVSPKDAASVILVRKTAEDHEALLVRKHTKLSFFGGAWVFPGGRCESADLLPDDMYRAAPGKSGVSRGLVVAVCRETFEEVGVLLARTGQGGFCTVDDVENMQHWREEISGNAAVFETMLRENRLILHEEDFLYWANWLTPSIVPKRYDTHFFVATMPPGQEVKCDNDEATELLWQSLGDFDVMAAREAVPAPPTRYSLADLAECLGRCGQLSSLFERESDRPIPKLLPKVVIEDDKRTTVMPWHSEYASMPGDGETPGEVPSQYLGYPDHVTRWRK